MNRREPHNWGAHGPRPLAVGASLTPRNTPLPKRVIMLILVVQTVRALLRNLTIVSRLSRSSEPDTDLSAPYDFLLTFQSNHGPISYRFRDKRRLQSKIANFSHPVYFAPRWRGPSWNSVPAQGKKLEWLGYRAEKNVWRYLQPSGYNTNVSDERTDRQTDRHRPTTKTELTHSVAR